MAYNSKKDKDSKKPVDDQALITKWRARKSEYEKKAYNFIKEGKDAWAEFLAGSSKEEYEEDIKRGDRAYAHVSRYVQGSYYSRTPQVVGTGDFDKNDSVGNTAAFLAERLGKRFVQSCWFGESIEGARDDYVHTSRGITRVYVESEFVSVPVRKDLFEQVLPLPMDFMPEINPETGEPIMPEPEIVYVTMEGLEIDPKEVKQDEQGFYYEEQQEELKTACPYLGHISFKDYFHTPTAKTRSMLTYEGYCLQMDLTAVKERWPDKYDDIEECHSADKEESGKDYVEIYECWDKATKTVCYLYLAGEGVVLDAPTKDPYGLEGFFPSIGPIVSNKLTDRLWGMNDYVSYLEKLDYLKGIDRRKRYLAGLLRRSGIGDGKHRDTLQPLNEATRDGDIVFVDNFVDLVSDANQAGSLIKFFPVDQYVAAFQECQEAYFNAKQEYYEYFGLEKLVQAQRTGAKPQDEEALMASLGLLYITRTRKFQEFIQENIRRLIDLALHILPEKVFKQLVGYEFLSPIHRENFPKAYEVLQNDFNRAIRVDVETDSTIAGTAQLESEANMQLFNLVTQSLGPLTDIAQTKPELMAPLAGIIMSAVGKMKGGSGASNEIAQAFKEMAAVASQPPEQAGPTPEEINAQTKQMLADHKIELENREQAFKEALETEKLRLDEFIASIAAKEKLMEEERLAQKHQMTMMPKVLDLEKKMAEMELEKIKTAQVAIQSQAQQAPAPAPEPRESVAEMMMAMGSVLSQSLQNIPQPIINVAAPQPTRRVGTIQKNGDTARIVVDEEGI